MPTNALVDAGAIAAAVLILVGLVALWIPATVDSDRRTAILRTASVALGVVFAILSDLAAGLSGFANLVPAGLAGLTIGATVTITVAGVKAGQSSTPTEPAVPVVEPAEPVTSVIVDPAA